jgi:Type I phosphodiesterase / nucleotide pyrophosphatase
MIHLPFAYVGPGAGFAFLGSFLTLLLSLLASLASLLLWPFRMLLRLVRKACGTRRAHVKKAIFLGLDGLDPELTEKLIAEGKLPHLARLKDQGSCRRLRTSCPAAWSAFATGVTSAKQASESFWKILGRNGVESTILRVPGTFPVEGFEGRLLSAAPTRHGPSHFTKRAGLIEADGSLAGELAGPGDTVMFWIRDPEGEPVLYIQDSAFLLTPHEYTPWIRLKFGRVHGIVRFLLTHTGDDFSLHATAVHIDPEHPSVPISHPPYYASYLAKLLGPFSTLDVAEDSVISEDDLLEQARLIQSESEAIFFSALDHQESGVVACVFDNYCDMDRLIGRTLEHADTNTIVFILSSQGVLFSNRKLDAENPGIEDMAPTALRLFDIEPPEWMEGKSVIHFA